MLAADDIDARVVSMPCLEWFDEQDAAYRDTVIPPIVKARVSVEAGVNQGWRELVGDRGRIVSVERYGASAAYAAHLRGATASPPPPSPTRPATASRQPRTASRPRRSDARDRLQALADAGVSIWLDDLSRERIETGNLADLVKESNVVGVTTNPTIFAGAISDGERYDDQVRKLVADGADVAKVVFELTTEDVRNACDVLAPVAESTGRRRAGLHRGRARPGQRHRRHRSPRRRRSGRRSAGPTS